MSKPFFYRLNASDFFAVVRELSDKECAKWLRTFASDLVAGNTLNGFTQSLIDEAKKYKENKSLAGKKGMEKRYQSPNTVITQLQQNPNTDITSNRSSNSNNTETIKDKVKRFVPPSVSEVETYMKEIDFNGDAQKFVNYYTANGWKVGRNSMKDWKAAVRTWRGNNNQRSLAIVPAKETETERILRENAESCRQFVERGNYAR